MKRVIWSIAAVVYLMAAIGFWNVAVADGVMCFEGRLDGYAQFYSENYAPDVSGIDVAIALEYIDKDDLIYLNNVRVRGWEADACFFNGKAPVQGTVICSYADEDITRIDIYHVGITDGTVKLFMHRTTDGFVGDVDFTSIQTYEGIGKPCDEEDS